MKKTSHTEYLDLESVLIKSADLAFLSQEKIDEESSEEDEKKEDDDQSE